MQIFAHWAKKLDNNIRHFTHNILYKFCCLRHKNKLLTHSEITEICHNGFPFPSTYFNLSVWMEGSDPWSQIQNSKTSMYEFSFFFIKFFHFWKLYFLPPCLCDLDWDLAKEDVMKDRLMAGMFDGLLVGLKRGEADKTAYRWYKVNSLTWASIESVVDIKKVCDG